MPIYEYECPDCQGRFERLVKMSDPVPDCPTCGGARVRKLVSAAAFVLKGGGWYKDHYGLKKSESKSEGGESKPASSESKPSSSESKPASSEARSTSSESKPPAAPSGGGSTTAPSSGTKAA